MSATVDALERLHDYDELDEAFEGSYPGAAIDDVDEEALRRALGDPAVQDLRRLKQIERTLEDGRASCSGAVAGSSSRPAARARSASER